MFFGSVSVGKAYVSFHLMPLYMCPVLLKRISPELHKRMHGKTCFNFTSDPGPELVLELEQLTAAALEQWEKTKWAVKRGRRRTQACRRYAAGETPT
jgi:hypothetical protein